MPGIGSGLHVTRATALPPASGAATTIFTVGGGLVRVTGFLGLVTVAVPAAFDYTINFDPTLGGSNIDLGALLEVDSDPAGTFYLFNDTLAGALVASTDIAGEAALEQPFILQNGNIVWTVAGGGTQGTTCRVRWDIWYVPIDDAAVIFAVG